MRKNQFGYNPFAPVIPGIPGIPGLPGGPPPPAPAPSLTPPPAPPPPPPPSPPPAPPTTPNYLDNLVNDPIYQQQMATLSAQGIQDASQRKAATDRALIQFGEIPNFGSAANGLGLSPDSPLFGFLTQDVDAATRKAALGQTNAGLSTVAKLRTGHNTALDSLMSQLAARGIVRSGSTGVGVGLENKNYLDAQFTARNQLLDYLSGVQAAFSQSESLRQQQQAGYLGDAATRQIQVNPDTGPPPPPPPPSSSPLPPFLGGYVGGLGGLPGTNFTTLPYY